MKSLPFKPSLMETPMEIVSLILTCVTELLSIFILIIGGLEIVNLIKFINSLSL